MLRIHLLAVVGKIDCEDYFKSYYKSLEVRSKVIINKCSSSRTGKNEKSAPILLGHAEFQC